MLAGQVRVRRFVVEMWRQGKLDCGCIGWLHVLDTLRRMQDKCEMLSK